MSEQEREKTPVHIHYSWRGLPLIYVEKHDVPIVTMENYCKWYGIQVVHPDGKVENVDVDLLDKLCGSDVLMGDHNYHPILLRRVAKHYGGHVDGISLEAAGGRWKAEIEDYVGFDE